MDRGAWQVQSHKEMDITEHCLYIKKEGGSCLGTRVRIKDFKIKKKNKKIKKKTKNKKKNHLPKDIYIHTHTHIEMSEIYIYICSV